MPGRPDSGELAQAGIDALAVERLCMRPEGTAELDARCDFDALRRDGQRLELVADRMFRVLVGEAERTIETGEVDKTPEQSGEPWHRGLARSVVAAFLFGTLRQLLGRRAQHLEIAGRRIGRALLRSHFAQPVGGLIAEERAVRPVFGTVNAGETAPIVGFCFRQERRRQDRGRSVGRQTVAGDPPLAAARLLDTRSETQTSELQSLMRIEYAVLC